MADVVVAGASSCGWWAFAGRARCGYVRGAEQDVHRYSAQHELVAAVCAAGDRDDGVDVCDRSEDWVRPGSGTVCYAECDDRGADGIDAGRPAGRDHSSRLRLGRSMGPMRAAVIILIFVAIVALLNWATLNFGMGAKTTFGQNFAVAMYAGLPKIFIGLLNIVFVYAGVNTENFDLNNPVGTNIGYYMTRFAALGAGGGKLLRYLRALDAGAVRDWAGDYFEEEQGAGGDCRRGLVAGGLLVLTGLAAARG